MSHSNVINPGTLVQSPDEPLQLPDARALPRDGATKLGKVATLAGLAGVVLFALGMALDHDRFSFSYLVGFGFTVTLAIGALSFVVIQHLARAGWSVAPRRQMEWLASFLIPAGLLFIPLLIPMKGGAAVHKLYPWLAPEALHDELLVKKAGYLNLPFFVIRAVVFFGVWGLLAKLFTGWSRRQDHTGDVAPTLRMQVLSAPACMLIALATTFAAFDWFMSLDPHWYSTIFGFYVLAGSLVSSLAALSVMVVVLQRFGLYRRICNVEHQHDIGKLFFGFTVFWAYIAFSQYFLIWYANLPEETIFFRHRWEGSWRTVSLVLLFGHFVLPFLVLLSRHAKRNQLVLAAAAVWMLAMHYLDIYWLVMPNLDHHGAHFSWVDLAGLAGPIGVLLVVIARQAIGGALYPVRDPRLADALKTENL
jgi:hypothetical protein